MRTKRLISILCSVVIAATAFAGPATESHPAKRASSRDLYVDGSPGTKVSIELNRNGNVSRVSPDTTFHSGDKVRFHFGVNFDGYVAVLNEGSSGRHNLLFPFAGANNAVHPTSDYVVPRNGWIVFDENPGREKVVFILSANPIPELQQIQTSAAASSGGSTGGTASGSEEQEILAALNSRAMQHGRQSNGGRDLVLDVDGNSGYVATNVSNLSNPLGFELILTHR
jgi:Domain of unknown function (DUF4384)